MTLIGYCATFTCEYLPAKLFILRHYNLFGFAPVVVLMLPAASGIEKTPNLGAILQYQTGYRCRLVIFVFRHHSEIARIGMRYDVGFYVFRDYPDAYHQ